MYLSDINDIVLNWMSVSIETKENLHYMYNNNNV